MTPADIAMKRALDEDEQIRQSPPDYSPSSFLIQQHKSNVTRLDPLQKSQDTATASFASQVNSHINTHFWSKSQTPSESSFSSGSTPSQPQREIPRVALFESLFTTPQIVQRNTSPSLAQEAPSSQHLLPSLLPPTPSLPCQPPHTESNPSQSGREVTIQTSLISAADNASTLHLTGDQSPPSSEQREPLRTKRKFPLFTHAKRLPHPPRSSARPRWEVHATVIGIGTDTGDAGVTSIYTSETDSILDRPVSISTSTRSSVGQENFPPDWPLPPLDPLVAGQQYTAPSSSERTIRPAYQRILRRMPSRTDESCSASETRPNRVIYDDANIARREIMNLPGSPPAPSATTSRRTRASRSPTWFAVDRRRSIPGEAGADAGEVEPGEVEVGDTEARPASSLYPPSTRSDAFDLSLDDCPSGPPGPQNADGRDFNIPESETTVSNIVGHYQAGDVAEPAPPSFEPPNVPLPPVPPKSMHRQASTMFRDLPSSDQTYGSTGQLLNLSNVTLRFAENVSASPLQHGGQSNPLSRPMPVPFPTFGPEGEDDQESSHRYNSSDDDYSSILHALDTRGNLNQSPTPLARNSSFYPAEGRASHESEWETQAAGSRSNLQDYEAFIRGDDSISQHSEASIANTSTYEAHDDWATTQNSAERIEPASSFNTPEHHARGTLSAETYRLSNDETSQVVRHLQNKQRIDELLTQLRQKDPELEKLRSQSQGHTQDLAAIRKENPRSFATGVSRFARMANIPSTPTFTGIAPGPSANVPALTKMKRMVFGRDRSSSDAQGLLRSPRLSPSPYRNATASLGPSIYSVDTAENIPTSVATPKAYSPMSFEPPLARPEPAVISPRTPYTPSPLRTTNGFEEIELMPISFSRPRNPTPTTAAAGGPTASPVESLTPMALARHARVNRSRFTDRQLASAVRNWTMEPDFTRESPLGQYVPSRIWDNAERQHNQMLNTRITYPALDSRSALLWLVAGFFLPPLALLLAEGHLDGLISSWTSGRYYGFNDEQKRLALRLGFAGFLLVWVTSFVVAIAVVQAR